MRTRWEVPTQSKNELITFARFLGLAKLWIRALIEPTARK